MNKTSKILLGMLVILVLVSLWQFQAGRRLERRLEEAHREIAQLKLAQSPLPAGQPAPVDSKPAQSSAHIEGQVQQLESEVLRLRALASRGIQAEAELAEIKSRKAAEGNQTSIPAPTPPASGSSESLITYLGDAVPVPADLNPAYSKEGLVTAVQQAASAAGVSPKKIEIDTSEFPFLAGVICNDDAEFERIKEQFKKINGYEYGGSVSSHGVYAFTLVPHRAYPSESSERISRRTTLRQRMLFDQLVAGQNKN